MSKKSRKAEAKAEKRARNALGIGASQRAFEAASLGGRLSAWRPNRSHINPILAAEAATLRARSRQQIANAPYGANASETFTTYATGTGIVPSPTGMTADQKAAVMTAWTDWTDEADADGLTDFYGLQSLCARALFDAGECFVRRRDRRPSDGLSVPMQLQVIEADQLDPTYTFVPAANPNNVIRMGIEFDPIGRRVAYHFFQKHPGDSTIPQPNAVRVRVPADQVLHLYQPLRPGQIRGKPRMTSALVKMKDIDDYDDAEIQRKLGAAMHMAFITHDPTQDASQMGLTREADSHGKASISMEPMTAQVLPPGFDVRFNTPADVGPNFEAFEYRQLLALCAAMGLPYHAVTGDHSKANYSSLRSALIELKRRIGQFQNEVLIFQLCRPIWNWWLPAAVLAGTVSLARYAQQPRPYHRVKWVTPAWEWIDPLKETQAAKVAVDSGFMSRSDIIEQQGEDPETVDERIAADHERERKLGLEFPVGFSKSPDAPAGGDLNPQGADLSAGTSGDGGGSQAAA